MTRGTTPFGSYAVEAAHGAAVALAAAQGTSPTPPVEAEGPAEGRHRGDRRRAHREDLSLDCLYLCARLLSLQLQW